MADHIRALVLIRQQMTGQDPLEASHETSDDFSEAGILFGQVLNLSFLRNPLWILFGQVYPCLAEMVKPQCQVHGLKKPRVRLVKASKHIMFFVLLKKKKKLKTLPWSSYTHYAKFSKGNIQMWDSAKATSYKIQGRTVAREDKTFRMPAEL